MHEQFSHPDLAHVRNRAHESLFNFQLLTECINSEAQTTSVTKGILWLMFPYKCFSTVFAISVLHFFQSKNGKMAQTR